MNIILYLYAYLPGELYRKDHSFERNGDILSLTRKRREIKFYHTLTMISTIALYNNDLFVRSVVSYTIYVFIRHD